MTVWQRSLACFTERVQSISTFLSQAGLTSPLKAKERKVNSRPQDADLHHSANREASLARISDGPVLTRDNHTNRTRVENQSQPNNSILCGMGVLETTFWDTK